MAVDPQGGVLVTSGKEEPCPISVHAMIPFYEGSPTVRSHTSEILSLGFKDQDVLLTGTKNGSVQLTIRGYGDKKSKVVKSLYSGEGPVHSVIPLADHSGLASGNDTGKLVIWDLERFKIKRCYGVTSKPLLKVARLKRDDNSRRR